jgi:leucyl-tRNA synthetase
MKKYNHKQTEEKWRKMWLDKGIYQPEGMVGSGKKEKFYNLWMFPYPSAEGVHVGTIFSSTGSDVYGKYKRMSGKSVFQPIGYDSFGIHSENYAIKLGENPKTMLERTISHFEQQLKMIGHGYDWTRTVTTSDVGYYKWTQWLFLQLFKAGLAYRKAAKVNWCPSCKTVLADEQVVTPAQAGKEPRNAKGKTVVMEEGMQVCERCGTLVEEKKLEQWFFRITDYADRLLENLEKIDWSERVVTAQRNWIGKSEGAKISFQLSDVSYQLTDTRKSVVSKSVQKIENQGTAKPKTDNRIPTTDNRSIEVFTTRPDTLYGATFIVVSPEYAKENLISLIPESNEKKITQYINQSLSRTKEERVNTDKQKTGVDTGIKAINPATEEEVPIYVADYVLSEYGTGAIMGVPAHDERDFEFAKKYDLEIKPVVVPERDYIDDNAESYYQKRSKLHKDLLIDLANSANKANKKMIVNGGWAVYLQVGKEFRDFEDLDLVIFEEDVDWWKNELTKLGMKIKNLFPEGKNKKYYFQAVKKDVHVDVGAMRLEKDGKVVWLEESKERKGDLFKNIFEEKKINGSEVYAMNKDVLYYVKKKRDDVRWKEKADFLFMGFETFDGDGKIINSGSWDGLRAPGQMDKVIKDIEAKGWGKGSSTYHLRDWLISRQRYWGAPIPMIYCEACAMDGRSWFSESSKSQISNNKQITNDKLQNSGKIGNSLIREDQSDWEHSGWWPEENLPVELPFIDDYKPEGTGRGPLSNHPEFYEVKCPHCGTKARRETDVMDTFVDSSWYFLRYPSVQTQISNLICKKDNLKSKKFQTPNTIHNSLPWHREVTRRWLPVDLYFGGAEHSVLHLMYSRFVTMALHDLEYLDFEEPFPRFFAHGLMIKDGAKMSKSRGNVVNPDEYIEKFGADTLRLYLMFMGPMDGYPDFRDTGIEGMRRFTEKVWKLYQFSINNFQFSLSIEEEKKIQVKMHQTIKKVTEDVEKFHYNTAIAAIMEFVNLLREVQSSVVRKSVSTTDKPKTDTGKPRTDIWKEALRSLALLLAPFAPFITEELYQRNFAENSILQLPNNKQITNHPEQQVYGAGKTQNTKRRFASIHLHPWPTYDPKLVKEETVQVVVQVNGKLRGTLKMEVAEAQDKERVVKAAMKEENVTKWLEGKSVKKEIFVPGRLVNFVVG